MSISYGLNLGIMNGAADGDLYGNAMRAFQRACDAFLQPIVKGYLTNTPPGSPVDGDMYIVGSAPTGSWASYAGYVAKWSALLAAWEFYLPKDGWQFQSNSAREIYRRTGGAWEIFYQQGTWTPQLVGRTTPGTQTYSTQLGIFTKLGRSISVSFDLILTAFSGASGTAQVTGLPYPAAGLRFSGSVGTVGNITFPAGCTTLGLYANATEPVIILTQIGSGLALTNLDQSAIAATSAIRGSLTYSN